MNLPTHVVAAFAIGIALFHNVELALIMSMGAVIPDLDRDYFFVARDFIGRHQTHRALFHNFLLAALLYLVSPFLALGALSHYFLDIFTSASDRGVELLFPFTRRPFVRVNAWLYTIEGKKENGAEKLKWWVEDPYRLLKETTESDLKEPEKQPWRRSYGPFKNSRIVDFGIFFASIIFLGLAASALALGTNYYSLTELLSLSTIAYWALVMFFLGVVMFYVLGYFYQKQPETQKRETKLFTAGGLIVGLFLLLLGGILGWIGGIFFVRWPSSSTLNMLGIGLIAIIIGLYISYRVLAIYYAYKERTQDLTL